MTDARWEAAVAARRLLVAFENRDDCTIAHTVFGFACLTRDIAVALQSAYDAGQFDGLKRHACTECYDHGHAAGVRETWRAAGEEIDVELTLQAEREREPIAVDALCRFRDQIAAALVQRAEGRE